MRQTLIESDKHKNQTDLLWSHHGVDGLDDSCHLIQVDPPIAIRVVHTENV